MLRSGRPCSTVGGACSCRGEPWLGRQHGDIVKASGAMEEPAGSPSNSRMNCMRAPAVGGAQRERRGGRQQPGDDQHQRAPAVPGWREAGRRHLRGRLRGHQPARRQARSAHCLSTASQAPLIRLVFRKRVLASCTLLGDTVFPSLEHTRALYSLASLAANGSCTSCIARHAL